jgi:Sec-independent protein secretion pathway component TatC
LTPSTDPLTQLLLSLAILLLYFSGLSILFLLKN